MIILIREKKINRWIDDGKFTYLLTVVRLVSQRENIPFMEFFRKKIKSEYVMYYYLAMGLSYDLYSACEGKIMKIYTIDDIGFFFGKRHPNISIAKKHMDSWIKTYKLYGQAYNELKEAMVRYHQDNCK